MMKICLYCKNEFETAKKNRKFCCKEHFNLNRVGKRKAIKDIAVKLTTISPIVLESTGKPQRDITRLTLGEILDISLKNGELREKISLLENKLKSIHEVSFLKDIVSHPPAPATTPATEPQKTNLDQEIKFRMINGELTTPKTIDKEAALRFIKPIKAC